MTPPQEKNKSTKGSSATTGRTEKKNSDAEVVSLSKGKTKITRLYSQSFLFLLWIVSGVLSYGNRIPGISKILKLIAL